MTQEPLLTTLLDLDSALNSPQRLLIGGGYGLYLKQLYILNNPQIRTLFPVSNLPTARTTEDIDLTQAFTYLLMKLCAYRDRMNDADKNLGQHHALDLYRIVGLLTQKEDADVRRLCAEFANHPVLIDARRIAAAHFVASDGIGRLRIREHPLYTTTLDLDRFAQELQLLLSQF